MDGKVLNKWFCKESLKSLKSFRHKEFTVEFLERHNLPQDKDNLTQMWAEIQKWLAQGDYSRCLDLLEYVDGLKMWGRQRIFLYEIKDRQGEFTKLLSDQEFASGLFGDVEEKPICHSEAGKPFLAEVKHTTDSYTDARLLVFKIIEMRAFEQLIDGSLEPDEERSTNFFIVNLKTGFAELRLQNLPVRAHKRLNEERTLFEEEIKNYLNLDNFRDKFKPIQLEPIMSEMLRRPIYTITSTQFKASKAPMPGVPTLVTVIHQMFSNPIPKHMAAYWECDQDVLGDESRLHFSLYGSNDSIAFGGLADPRRVSDILKKIIDIYRQPPKKDPLWKRGLVDDPYKNLEGQPRAQAVVLATGAVAALLIWIVIEGVGNYLLEEWVESILKGFPLIVITLLIELAWTVRFYGWNRIKRSFETLRSTPPSQIWKAFRQARSGDLDRK